MRPIDRNEILPIGAYEQVREHFRARVIAEKRPRRVKVGDHLSAVFENRDSVLLQIQEMLRTERISSEPAIKHEIETYNELVPGDNELSITLFVEIPERELRDRMLIELAGLERHLGIEVNGERYMASSPPRPGAVDDRTTAVHYLKIRLPEGAAGLLKERRATAALVVTLPRHEARADLSAATLAKLAEDLSG
jgi:hypothetical protein